MRRISFMAAAALLACAAPAAAEERPVPAIAPGGSVTGALSANDLQRSSGKYSDVYTLAGRRGDRIELRLDSTDFDPMLLVTGPGGYAMSNDDDPDGGGAVDSRLVLALPQDGTYRPSQGSVRQAGVRGGPRIFALMIGVSDYGGRTTDLANTDRDAENLSAALNKAGLLNPASVVLTNAETTRAGVAAAFSRIAAQAGPEDLFLFFFSGHGDQVNAVPGARELDGLSETLELRDAELTDAELAGMFAKVRARTSLILIDSCFSGGFRELVSRPGMWRS